MTRSRFVFMHQVTTAHPKPSALDAAWVNSFLNRAKEPYSALIAFGKLGLPGLRPPFPQAQGSPRTANERRYPHME